MAPSRAPAVLAFVHAGVDAAVPTPVFLGDVPTGDTRDLLFLGYDGDPEGERVAVSVTREWVGTGSSRRRTERIEIVCAGCALVGTGSFAEATGRVSALMTAVDDFVTANPALGQPPPTTALVEAGDLFTDHTAAGLQARWVFRIAVTTRI